MSIGYRDGASGDNSNAPATAVIPADVQPGDVLLAFGGVYLNGGTPSSLSLVSAGPTAPSLIRSDPVTGINLRTGIFWWVAAAGDPGATLTFQSGGGLNYGGFSVVAYHGADTSSQPDVASYGDSGGSSVPSFTAPGATTATAGDWALYCAGQSGGSGISGNPGTLRQADASYNYAVIADSNGSVGGSGTVIGGGAWTDGSSGMFWGYTIGLKPAASLASPSGLLLAGIV